MMGRKATNTIPLLMKVCHCLFGFLLLLCDSYLIAFQPHTRYSMFFTFKIPIFLILDWDGERRGACNERGHCHQLGTRSYRVRARYGSVFHLRRHRRQAQHQRHLVQVRTICILRYIFVLFFCILVFDPAVSLQLYPCSDILSVYFHYKWFHLLLRLTNRIQTEWPPPRKFLSCFERRSGSAHWHRAIPGKRTFFFTLCVPVPVPVHIQSACAIGWKTGTFLVCNFVHCLF